jgi:hypothetical protein
MLTYTARIIYNYKLYFILKLPQNNTLFVIFSNSGIIFKQQITNK